MAANSVVPVVLSAIDEGNDARSLEVQRLLDRHGVVAVSLQGGGGCGKTTLLEAALPLLCAHRRCAVIEGDLNSTVDGERIGALGVPVVQINTHGACHLSANMLLEVLPLLELDAIDLLLIENIGNMHHTAKFTLGEHRRLACLATSGGQRVIDKYPASFTVSDLNLITKSSLASYVHFDIPHAVSRLHQLNPRAQVLVTDAVNGDGIDVFCRYLCRESERRA